MIDFNFGVRLGGLRGEDSSKLLQWRNSPSIYRWTRQSDVLTETRHNDWFYGEKERDDIKMYGVYHGAENKLVGVCGLTSIDTVARSAEFSLYIAPENQGAGLGKKALSTLLSHAFKTLNLHSVWGESLEGNPAMHIFRKLGFSEDGVQRDCYYKDGKYLNAHIFTILGDEWKF